MAAAGEVPIDGRGLFRRKLAIQIFPQSLRDVGTLHSHLILIAPGGSNGYALLNTAPLPEVPHG
jgi:hypothetical protein